jgi:hypothetical protein
MKGGSDLGRKGNWAGGFLGRAIRGRERYIDNRLQTPRGSYQSATSTTNNGIATVSASSSPTTLLVVQNLLHNDIVKESLRRVSIFETKSKHGILDRAGLGKETSRARFNSCLLSRTTM